MKAIGDMSTREVLDEIRDISDDFSPGDFDRLEVELLLRAASLCWTGDPLQQPPRVVLAAARAVKERQSAILQSALP